MKIKPKRKHKKQAIDVLSEQLPSPTEDNREHLKNVIITSCKDTLGFKTWRNQDWVDDSDGPLQQLITPPQKTIPH